MRVRKAESAGELDADSVERQIDLITEGYNEQSRVLAVNPLFSSRYVTGVEYTAGQKFSVIHKLNRTINGFFCTNGLKVRLADTQTDLARQVDLVVETGELVERKEIDTATTVVTFSDLDSTVDGGYRLRGKIIDPGSGTATTFYLNPNGSTADQEVSRVFSVNGAGPTAGTSSRLEVAVTPSGSWSTNRAISFEAFFTPTPGNRAAFSSTVGGGRSEASDNVALHSGGVWDSGVTVTYLEIESSTASRIGAGTWLELWRNTPKQKTADLLLF